MKIAKRIAVTAIAFILVLGSCMTASASQIRTVDSFTHEDTSDGGIKSVPMPDVYVTDGVVDAVTLGLSEDFGTISDIACDDKGHCYILSEDGVIVEFDNELKFVAYHNLVDDKGKAVDVTGARGIYVSGNELYISDTENGRVLCCINDIVVKEINMPESALIPSDFVFSPTKVVKDGKGYLYVISKGSYYGAVMYDPAGEFIGFYGANTVKGGVLTTLAYIWDSLTQNDVKRAKKVKSLPYQFVDICIDKNDFVYTCTGLTATDNNSGQIRMLSPGGTNILFDKTSGGARVDSKNFNFGETDYIKRLNKRIVQNFDNIQVDENGFIYALDITYGLVYVYDTDCNLITAFGGGRGIGGQKGIFASPIALAVSNNKVFVADSLDNSVTVFKQTDFGNKLLTAQQMMLKADYTESKEAWEYVLKKDSQNQLALRAIAKIALLEGDYEKAQEYAKEGVDYSVYSQALKKVHEEFITQNFTWLFIGGVLIVAVIIALIIYRIKKNIKLVKNIKVKIFLNCFIHPFDGFNAVRYEKKGSLVIAGVMAALFFVSSAFKELYCDFRYSSFNSETFSLVFILAKTVGLILLWSLADWGISVLLQGIGKFKDVLIVTAYSTLPIIVYNFISIPLSHIITTPSSALISGLSLAATIYTGIILSVGLMVIHNFSFPRYAVSVVVGLFFLFLIVFIGFVFGILISQLWSFLYTFFMELVFR